MTSPQDASPEASTHEALSTRPDGFSPEARATLTLLASVVFMAVLNGTMINVALPHIGQDFGASEGTYSWLMTGYAMTFGIFNAINGGLADRWGKRRMYVAGLTFLGACSLLVAAAPTLSLAIALRLVQGAGAAALPVLGTTIIKTVVSPHLRGRAIGVILSTVGVAASIGPFVGGFLVQFAHWRVVFLVPGLALLAVPVALRRLPASLDQTSDDPFDVVGATLMSVGIAALLYGFNVLQASGPGPWFMGVILAGVLSLLLFWGWSLRARSPFIPPTLLRQPDYVLSAALGMLVNATRFGSVVLAPIMLTRLNHLEPIAVGATLFPGALAIAVLSPRAGAMADSRGPRLPATIGAAALLVGCLICAFCAGTSVLGVTVGLTFFGVGFAMCQSPLVRNVTTLVSKQHEAVGIGTFMMVFFIGGAAGVALAVTITELQGPQAPGVAGLGGPGAGPFADAFLALAALAALGVALAVTGLRDQSSTTL